jgi:trehalose 6-phosphate synthase/phosphatase
MQSAKASLSDAVTISRGGPLILLLDYDGTLVPIAATPDLATPDPELFELLEALVTRPHLDIHIVSGRRRDTIERWFGHLAVSLWAEHGFWHRPATSGAWEAAGLIPVEALEQTMPVLERFTKETPGSFIEEKAASLAWHYRLVTQPLAQTQARAVQVVLETILEGTPLEVLRGKKVIEVRPRGISKALVARRVLGERPYVTAVLAVGDDETDEELFRALPKTAVTVAVGPGPTSAKHVVEDHHAARELIRALIA